MHAQSFLKIRIPVPDNQQVFLAQIDQQFQALSPLAVEEQFVQQVLNLMYEALQVEQHSFIKDVFLDFYRSSKKTQRHKTAIHASIPRLQDITDTVEEQIFLVNTYRSVVADLYDPYITLIVALLQFKEGTYTTIVSANLGDSERGKTDFALARLHPTQLFRGYDPVVRNAVAHAGSEGITYEGHTVLFKNIRRGPIPVVTSVRWSTEDLYKRIVALMDFVHSIQIAIDIFGIDIGHIMLRNADLNDAFVEKALSSADRAAIRKKFDAMALSIMESDVEQSQKLDTISSLFFLECGTRNMPVTAARFKSEKGIILIEIPNGQVDVASDDALLKRAMAMVRYGVIAEPCYRRVSTTIIIREATAEGYDHVQATIPFDVLRDYGNENAGIFDILHEGNFEVNDQQVRFHVDFEQLKRLEDVALDTIHPRR